MRHWLFIAALNGLIAVAAGAFAVHGLQGRLDAHALEIFETGARYQMYHALALGLVALVMRDSHSIWAHIAAWAFFIGIILFSGSLYVMALTANHMAAYATPLGGACFFVGWFALAVTALRYQKKL